MAKIGMIGAGSWGIALSVLLHNNGHDITVWSALKEEIEMLTREHEHKEKLPGVKLAEEIVDPEDIETLQDAYNGACGGCERQRYSSACSAIFIYKSDST